MSNEGTDASGPSFPLPPSLFLVPCLASRLRAELAVDRIRDRSVVTRARPAGPLRLLAPAGDGAAAWVYQSSLGGGFVGDDAIALDVEVGAGAALFLSSQSAGKVYRGARASYRLDARVGAGGALVAWPDPTMCYAGAAVVQDQRFALAGDAALVAVDAWSAGRVARGERWAHDRLAARLAIDIDGARVLDDAVLLAATHGDIAARLAGVAALATVVVVGTRLAAACDALASRIATRPLARPLVAASRWPWGLVVRAAAPSTAALTATLRELLAPVTAVVLGRDPWARKW